MKNFINAATSVSLLALAVYSIQSMLEKHKAKRYTAIPCGTDRFSKE